MAVFDFGISVKRFREFLSQQGFEPTEISLFISHEHSDHAGNAMAFSNRVSRDIYARKGTLNAMGMDGYSIGDSVVFGNFLINAVDISHDACEPVAFVVETSGKKISIVSDLGQPSLPLLEKISDSDILALEANHDTNMLVNGTYPDMLKKRIRGEKGHLSNEQCGRIAASVSAEKTRIVLLHLSQHNNTPEIALNTVKAHMDSAGKAKNEILCASQADGCGLFVL